MKNIEEIKREINSACNVISLQSSHRPHEVRDSDLIIDLRSEVESCDNDDRISDCDKSRKCLPKEYNFVQDIEKLIEVSKQFQTDYENGNKRNIREIPADDQDEFLNIPILNSDSLRQHQSKTNDVNPSTPSSGNENYYFSNCTSRKENVFSFTSNRCKKTLTPKKSNAGPSFGTCFGRPSPKKHSCIRKTETISTKRSTYRAGWNVRPYAVRYYNFDRTHPDLRLVDDGNSMIPKRIAKGPTRMTNTTPKPLLNKGLTWHEFFERINVYSAKSFQSSCDGNVPTNTITTQAGNSEVLTPSVSNDGNKIQKHILPQLNIRPECCVQRIPEISIPSGPKHIVHSNIKLLEIIYDEPESKAQTIEAVEHIVDASEMGKGKATGLEHLYQELDKEKQKAVEPEHFPELESMESIVNERVKFNESQTQKTSPTSSENNEYDSSLEESVSLNVSRNSVLSSILTDHATNKRRFKDVSIQTQKVQRIAKLWNGVGERQRVTSSSHCITFDNDAEYPSKAKLPTFPTNALIQMVDEIFDTSSDAANSSYKYGGKETISVQTDIVWENIVDLFNRESATIKKLEPKSGTMTNEVHEIVAKPETISVGTQHVPSPCTPSVTCQGVGNRSQMRMVKMCAPPYVRSDQSSSSSSSTTFDSRPSMPAAKARLLPSERYKQMKRAQREHFENDPRISRTLNKIYASAKTIEPPRKEMNSSSSSSDQRCSTNDPPSRFKFRCRDDNGLQPPDLFTFTDGILLFDFGSSDDIRQYPSDLLKTDSCHDTSSSNDCKYFTLDSSSHLISITRNNLFCTNSEESSRGSAYDNQRGSDLERCLFKDIENSGSDPSTDVRMSSVFSTSSLERKINEFQLR